MYKNLLKTLKVLVVIIAFLSNSIQAQDPVLSQFYAAPLQLNPAFAGITNSPKINLNYRNQWSSIFNAYTTYAASYDQYLQNVNSGIGFAVLMDRAGDGIYNTGNFNIVYSYKLPINQNTYIKGGIQAGLYQVSLDWDKLVFIDQLDPISGQTQLSEENRPDQLSKSYFDVSTGLLVYNRLFYGGISIFHLNSPNESILNINEGLLNGLPMRLSLHGGMQIYLSKDNKTKNKPFISPNILYTKQDKFQQLNIGAYAGMSSVFAGAWFRHSFGNPDAVIFSLGFSKSLFKIGYSYDYTISRLNSESNGSHELSVLINFEKENRRKHSYNDCFNLFR